MRIVPIKKLHLPDEIIEQIRNIILKEELKPGDKLPSERELAESFGVGRTTIREALKALSYTQIISRSKKGAFVNIKASEFFTDSLAKMIFYKDIDTRDLFEVRKLIEAKTAALASENATEEDIKSIKDSLDKMIYEEEKGNKHRFIIADLLFHETVAKASKNKILSEFIIAVRHLLWAAQESVLSYPGIMKDSIEYHRLIYGAIIKKDGEKARELILEHLENVEEALLNLGAINVKSKEIKK